MKRGFELIPTRPISEKLDVDVLEDFYSIKIPPLYKVFAETFVLREDLILSDKYLSSNGSLFHASYFVYEENREVMFGGFNDLDKALSLKSEVDEWNFNGYIPIGYCGFNGGIVLGTEGESIDKIILHDFDGDTEFTLIADNIFEFVRGLVLVPVNEAHLKDGLKFSHFYRKWGEGFWRISEENIST